MRHSLLPAVLLFAALLAPAAAQAQSKPINLALFDPVQIFQRDQSIHGFRFNLLYGNNNEMVGLDLGLVNRATGPIKGVQWGFVHWGESSMVGVQMGLVDLLMKGEGTGAQLSAVNLAEGMTGLQWGVVNYSARVKGLQLGLVNITDNLEGLQIGLVNVAKNGFLPIFVIFNFAF